MASLRPLPPRGRPAQLRPELLPRLRVPHQRLDLCTQVVLVGSGEQLGLAELRAHVVYRSCAPGADMMGLFGWCRGGAGCVCVVYK